MPQSYAVAVKGLLNELVLVIQQRATSDLVLVGEVAVGGTRELTSQVPESGIYVMMPSDGDTEFAMQNKRRPTLTIEVAVFCRSLDPAQTTDRLLDLVGLVIDAVGGNPKLNGKADIARAVSTEPVEVSENDVSLQASVVTIEARITHTMT